MEASWKNMGTQQLLHQYFRLPEKLLQGLEAALGPGASHCVALFSWALERAQSLGNAVCSLCFPSSLRPADTWASSRQSNAPKWIWKYKFNNVLQMIKKTLFRWKTYETYVRDSEITFFAHTVSLFKIRASEKNFPFPFSYSDCIWCSCNRLSYKYL